MQVACMRGGGMHGGGAGDAGWMHGGGAGNAGWMPGDDDSLDVGGAGDAHRGGARDAHNVGGAGGMKWHNALQGKKEGWPDFLQKHSLPTRAFCTV